MHLERLFTIGLVSAVAIFTAGVGSAAPVSADTLAQSQMLRAVSTSLGTPDVISGAPVPTDATREAAIDAKVGGVAVEIPTDPADGIALDPTSGPAVKIGLPSGNRADDAIAVERGVVAYDNNNGSVTVPIVGADGSVQILTTISEPGAPIRYSYPLALPPGSALQMTEYGGVLVTDGSGKLIANVAAPWAQDAAGTPVPTHFQISESTITQVVEHQSDGFVYPVTADPWWGWQFTVRAATANRIAALLTAGAGVAGIASAICAGTLVGLPCAAAWVIAAGLIAIGAGMLSFCNANGRGIVINITWNGWAWCTSR